MNVVTRIPPSPTGRFHIGTARTALFNYLFAKKHGGKFLFRIEDTDKERSKTEHEEDIIDGMRWLGLSFDGDIVRQSARQERHTELLQKLVNSGAAYLSKEASTKVEGEEVEVVRLKNTGRQITFHDEIRGDITFDTSELKDFVIGRAIDDPLYHFAVVVDDYDMGITHVIRGEDHISNTPRQILIQEALGFPRPSYAHLPLILAPDRSKLSKRHGAVSLLEYRQEGFLPEAIINYLALLGWNPKDEREEFTLKELIEVFDIHHVHKSGAVFDIVKFKHVNQRWMRTLSDDEYLSRGALPEDDIRVRRAVFLLKERATTFSEARAMLSGELACLFSEPKLQKSLLTQKEPEGKSEFTALALTNMKTLIDALPEDASVETIKEIVMPYADQEGRGAVLWPLRYALSGLPQSPDPFSLVYILGKTESKNRIQNALAILNQ